MSPELLASKTVVMHRPKYTVSHMKAPSLPPSVLRSIKLPLALLSASVLLGTMSSSSAATSIGASFIGRNTDAASTATAVLAPSESAGVVPQTQWNNIDSGTTFKGISASLLDSGAGFTAVRIIYDCSDSWNSDGGTATPDEKMMKGIIKANPDPDLTPANNSERMLFTITNLTASTAYNIIVYTIANGSGAQMDLTLGATTYYIGEQNSFGGTYILAGSTTPGSYDLANYAEFDGVTSTANGTITFTATKHIVDPQVNDGIGVAGIQIVRTSGSFPPNTSLCSITSSPGSTNVIIGFPVSFTVGTSGPHRTQWRTNGVDIPGAINDTYSIAATTAGDNGVSYVAVVYNNVVTNFSTAAILSTHANTVPATITANPTDTFAVEGGTASFSVSATGNFLKYQWQKNNVNILNATNSNYTTPPTVYPGDNGATFRVIVYNNVNTNTSTSALLTVDQNTPPALTQGFLRVERWENIGPGTGAFGMDDFKTNIAGSGVVGTTPTTAFYAGGANVPQSSPNVDNFGIRAWGWVKADVTGDYDFFIRGDDASQVFLNSTPAAGSGTNTIPDVQVFSPIAVQNTANQPFQEPGVGSATTASPIHLDSSKLYGIVILLKEGGGGDFVQVAWRPTTSTNAATTLGPITAPNVWTLATPAGQRASIVTQPASTTVLQGRRITFSVNVNTIPVAGTYSLQWYKNNVAIPGAINPTYTIPPAAYPGDNGAVFTVKALTLVGVLTSSNAVLTVQQDLFPPVALIGSITRNDGGIQVGVSFDEPINNSTLVPANFTVIGATTTTFNLATNSYGDYSGVVLDTTGLSPGGTYACRVKNVADVYGNAMPQTDFPFTVGPVKWAESGTPVRPGQIIPAGANGFDILNGGRAEWGTYDEITMAYVKKTNDFDVQVQVIYAEPSSQWSRVGLQARNGLDVGENPADRNPPVGGPASTVHAHAQTHVNPTQTLGSSGRFDPSGLAPVNQTPNNGHEQNVRLAQGAPTTNWGNPGDPPLYPDVWLRLQRVGTNLNGFRSSDGRNWTPQGSISLTDQQADMYVGIFEGVETGNIWSSDRYAGPFDPIYDRLFVAQFRNFIDVPSLSIALVAGVPKVTFSGTLQVSTTINGTFTTVVGATSPYTVPLGTTAKFYRVAGSLTER